MAYVKKPTLPQPDLQQKLARYMSLGKLISLLHRRELYFARLDKLGDDEFEGYLSRDEIFTQMKVTEEGSESLKAIPNWAELATETHFATLKEATKSIFANSWYAFDHENAAMWKEYAPNGQGIMVLSTFERFQISVGGDRDVIMSAVGYGGPLFAGDVFGPAIRKKDSYDYEKELRAIVWKAEETFPEAFPGRAVEARSVGLYVPCSPEQLISEIRVPPKSESWYKEMIEVTIRQFGFSIPVRNSEMDRP